LSEARGAPGPARLSGLAPLIGPFPSTLVLGSFPSAESLRRGEYYGFSRNHFWTLLAAVFAEASPESWIDKKAFLARHGVALWDVVAGCEREGSLDQAIREVETNPIPALLRDHPGIERIVLNGAKAAELFLRRVAGDPAGDGRGLEPVPIAPEPPVRWAVPGGASSGGAGRTVDLIRVPSSSPVPSREYRSMADKLSAWKAAFARG